MVPAPRGCAERSFVGFEAAAIYNEEAKNPKRTVPRATFLSSRSSGNLYSGDLSDDQWCRCRQIPGYIADLGDPTGFLFALSDAYIGGWYTAVIRLLFITSVFAAVLAFHNAVARYTFALGREGLLPEGAGHTHPKHLSPHVGSIAQSIVAVIVVAVFALTRQDAVLALFTWHTNLGTLGVIALMAATSFAVVAFFQRNRNLEHNMFIDPDRPFRCGRGSDRCARCRSCQLRSADRNHRIPVMVFAVTAGGRRNRGCSRRRITQEARARAVRSHGPSSRVNMGQPLHARPNPPLA